MFELIPITVAAIILSILSHRASEYDPIRCRYGRKDQLWFLVMAILLILFCGLRTSYNDTYNYVFLYESITDQSSVFQGIDWQLGENPAFWVANRIMRALNFSSQSYLMAYSVITVSLYLWFLRKYSCNLPLSIFLFFTIGIFTFTMAAVKQCVAMAICMVAIDRAIQRKYIPSVLWVLLAAAFHPYALMFLVVPLLMFHPWSMMSVLMMLLFAISGLIMERLIGTLVDMTTLLGENFDAESFLGEGVNPFRVAVVSVPLVLSFLAKPQIDQKNNRVQDLLVNLSILNAEIMFLGLFGTANYFARLANYFLPFQALALPWLLSHFEPRSRKMVTFCAVGGYSLYFLFSYLIMDSFDAQYDRISLLSYLQSLF